MRRIAPALAAALLALAACSREPPPPPENDTAAAEPAPAPEPTPAPEPPVEAPREQARPIETNDADVPEPIDESARTQDDADAVGMTTRASPSGSGEEDEAAATPGNEGGQ